MDSAAFRVSSVSGARRYRDDHRVTPRMRKADRNLGYSQPFCTSPSLYRAAGDSEPRWVPSPPRRPSIPRRETRCPTISSPPLWQQTGRQGWARDLGSRRFSPGVKIRRRNLSPYFSKTLATRSISMKSTPVVNICVGHARGRLGRDGQLISDVLGDAQVTQDVRHGITPIQYVKMYARDPVGPQFFRLLRRVFNPDLTNGPCCRRRAAPVFRLVPPGMVAPQSDVNRRICGVLRIGSTPGIIGTVMSAAAARSWRSKKYSLS